MSEYGPIMHISCRLRWPLKLFNLSLSLTPSLSLSRALSLSLYLSLSLSLALSLCLCLSLSLSCSQSSKAARGSPGLLEGICVCQQQSCTEGSVQPGFSKVETSIFIIFCQLFILRQAIDPGAVSIPFICPTRRCSKALCADVISHTHTLTLLTTHTFKTHAPVHTHRKRHAPTRAHTHTHTHTHTPKHTHTLIPTHYSTSCV